MFKILILLVCIVCSPVFAAVDFVEIKTSALISAASYANPSVINTRLNGVDYSLVHYNVLAGSELSYFLARAPSGRQFLSFRGTANLENALVDLDVSLKLNTDLNVQLHQGFGGAAKAAYTDVKSKLDKSQPINVTGHSLGGAVAVIMAMHLQRDGFLLNKVITFGQPKVTNVTGANVFANLPLTRVVTPKDIVPLVPPLSPLQLNPLQLLDADIFWHMGKEVILLADKNYAITDGLKSMMRATKFVSSVPDESNLHAHQMQTYLTLIDQKIKGALEVPYKTEISLFGFSLD
jgi:triacylglycerol lipase